MTAVSTRDPEEMDHAELRTEWDDVVEQLRSPPASQEQENTLWERRTALWSEMESRVDAELPECPECGEQSWSQTFGGPKYCDHCDYYPTGSEMELINAIDEYWKTVRSGPQEAEA